MSHRPLPRSLALRHWITVAGADLLLPRRAGGPAATELPAASSAEPRPAAPTAPPTTTGQKEAAVPPTSAIVDPERPEDWRAALPAATGPRLAALERHCANCSACELHAGRKQAVFADGAADAEIFFVGEGPGAQEDEQGVPFVGPAGQLLTRIIENAMGLPRRAVYIANVVKCRPPQNRNPSPEEQASCGPYLEEQIRTVRPKILICLGAVAARYLLRTKEGAGRLRGRVHLWEGIPLVVTWHPAYLLRNPAAKRETWDDVRLALRTLGRPEHPEPWRGDGE